jgi:hypothetical protein
MQAFTGAGGINAFSADRISVWVDPERKSGRLLSVGMRSAV